MTPAIPPVPAPSRSRAPSRNLRLDALIAEMSSLLGPVEDALAKPGTDTQHPLVLVIGCPRGGTTLLTQWLAVSGRFAVPSNLLARFARTPALGARIQLLLTDPRYALREDLFDLAPGGASGGFTSELGVTRGALAPSDFATFWRRFLKTQEMAPLGAERLARVDADALRASLAAIESAFEKPLAMKGIFLQYDLADFARLLPRAFFLRTRRDPVANALALLEARERNHGDRSVWYSARPAEYEALRGLDPIRQVAGQVWFTERAIDRGLAALPEGRSLSLHHERFCESPASAWAAIRTKLAALGCDVGATHAGPAQFEATSARRAASPDAPAVRAAFAELERQDAR